MLRGVAATLQQERDAARTIIIAHQRDKSAMEAQMAAVQADLDRANTRVNGLLEGREALPAPQVAPLSASHVRKKSREGKYTLSGVMTGASVPRSSPRCSMP